MDTIREYCIQSGTAVVRTNTYNKSFQHVSDMAQILIDELVGVSPEMIRVVLYAGRFYAKTLGVEVSFPTVELVPQTYVEIPSLELYYG